MKQNYKEDIEYYENAIKAKDIEYGEKKEDFKEKVGFLKLDLAKSCMLMGEEKKFKETMDDIRENHLSDKSYILQGEYYKFLGNYYENKNKFKESSNCYKKALEITIKNLNDDSLDKIEKIEKEHERERKQQQKEINRLKNIEIVKINEELLQAYNRLKEIYNKDPLTGTYNRRAIAEFLDNIKGKADNLDNVYIGILDFDNFKYINDTYGHMAGDYVLRKTSQIIKSIMNEEELIGRWGGDEFIIILKRESHRMVYLALNKIKRNVDCFKYSYDENNIKVSFTIGYTKYDENMGFDECLKVADDALYEGKKKGKNSIRYKYLY